MKHVLILSCSTGGGHNSVAQALKELMAANLDQCTVIDTLSFIGRQWPEIAADVHSYVYRHKPELFDKTYQYAERHRQKLRGDHPVRKLLDIGSRKLADYITANSITHVVCTHPFAGIMLSDAVKKYRLTLEKTAIVETDYTVSPGGEYSLQDLHFVPTNDIRDKLIGLGISKKQIVVSGIPIRKQFYVSHEKDSAKHSFGVVAANKHVVVASGSMGCGPIEEILIYFSNRNMPDFEVSVVCGNNENLYEQLGKKYTGNNLIHILPRVDNMSELLDSADVYMTKPGGISITEAAFKNVPMVLINEVGGCESHNLRFFTEKEAALTDTTVEGLCLKAIKVARDSEICQNIINSQNAIMFEHNISRIYDSLTQ